MPYIVELYHLDESDTRQRVTSWIATTEQAAQARIRANAASLNYVARTRPAGDGITEYAFAGQVYVVRRVDKGEIWS